jgi:hypothetical protein
MNAKTGAAEHEALTPMLNDLIKQVAVLKGFIALLKSRGVGKKPGKAKPAVQQKLTLAPGEKKMKLEKDFNPVYHGFGMTTPAATKRPRNQGATITVTPPKRGKPSPEEFIISSDEDDVDDLTTSAFAMPAAHADDALDVD